jgi:hypothetical protein
MRAKPKGIGDLAEIVFIKMGITSVVKKIAGDDCGCDKRREALNKLIPFNNGN